MYWITMDAPSPRSIFIAGWNDALPYCTVTLEPRPKSNHPYPVTLAHAALGLYVCQFIPQGAMVNSNQIPPKFKPEVVQINSNNAEA
jgi:hypothetical protein